ncbi:MAG: tRNA 2-thiouridine(34) synthase MnmA [Candidatus Peribacteraceae bacterium]|jgi:tRNA-specific 2-thiouridylase|nr:tRNA 2-thiouridine(34) synthase MnmA [Candidatus Peribacteraceae bacterium]
MKILVAMSGGIDSSVVAHMLKSQGHEVIGVRFTLWSDPLAPPMAQILPSKCCNAQTIARANQVAKDLDIPLHILDLEEEFKKGIVDPFLEGYKNGETPNPCVGCNRTLKFGKLLDFAKELGCEKLASGHYARIKEEEKSDGTISYTLLEAMDASKDQSYYLYGLNQDQLSKVMFPLSGLEKSEVFDLAKKYEIPFDSVHYQESQDLCFFPEKEPEEFLKRYLTDSTPGDIKLEDETLVGQHKGIPFYTIGQRKGLGIGGLKIPLHVVRKEVDSNTVYVAPNGADLKKDLYASDLNWISWEPQKNESQKFKARIHSIGTKHDGVMSHDGKMLHFRFDKGLRGIAAGQSIVLYKDEEIVGGGVITEEVRK